MHILFGKKQIALAGAVTVLGLAVFVNWYLSDGRETAPPEAAAEQNTVSDSSAEFTGLSPAEYFASVRLSRDSARQEAIEDLEAVMTAAGEDGNAAELAAALGVIGEEAQMETDIEGLVAGRIGGDSVAVITENTVDVIVTPETLNESNVLVIADIVSQVCEGKYENVKISAVPE